MKTPKQPDTDAHPELLRAWDRRQFIKNAAAGTALLAAGGALYRIAADDMNRKARAETRSDGRKRLPPGQRVIEHLKDMGGDPGDGQAKHFRLRVHGAVKTPYDLDYAQLLKLPQVEREADVHCVTGWSNLGATYKGVLISTLAEKAGVKGNVRHVILEAEHGFTSNIPYAEATGDTCMVTYRMNGKPFSLDHGAPARGLIPDLYFWKSAKWITGVKFVVDDEPGYWEVRGYHNHADPWKEERYA
ncbi:MAG: molybdopterin-dependent oxidoreductase [Kofleriaceae bacterium]|nr:molybdopterin-dependent oxidoreductase [Myxococcales bacterium]MCB9560192.1 molybdopterin-dependent oxidoreductase [Kofleriaceae bacterium]MCB9571245.1 molybdopterin-dependent oxidoreductase [Kofleriaceae bacterium]